GDKEKEPGDKDKEPGDKEPPKAKERPYRPFALQTWDGREAEKRVEAVVGVVAFNQACEDLAIVCEILEKKMVEAVERDRGTYAYPLTMRIYDPAKFSGDMVALMQQLKLLPRDTKDEANKKKVDAFTKALKERLDPLKGKIDS